MKFEIVIHHAAEKDRPDLNWDNIRKYHMTPASEGGPKGGPWRDIGYHFGIESVEGGYEVLIGRDMDDVGAHCPGHNASAFGVVFIGNFDRDEMPEEQLKRGAKFIASLMRTFRIPKDRIYKHSQFHDTKCPGEKFPWDKLMALLP